MKQPFIAVMLLACFLLFSQAVFCQTVPYPAVPGLTTSDVYKVKANGKTIWTEKFITDMEISKLPDWFKAPYVREQQEVHLANFSGEGKQEISITVPKNIQKVSVRPQSRGIKTKVKGNVVTFSIPDSDKLYIEIDSLAPLCLFANPIEKNQPSGSDSNVRYFGPGVHEAGFITLKDNETVYIAAGAIVYGGIKATDASNIKVIGRGILDGQFKFKNMVKLENCKNVLFEGVTIRYGNSWTNTIINSQNVKYNHVKVLSFGPGGDGINPLGSQNVEIINCFLRCTDDCIAIKAPSPSPDHVVKDVLVANNTMIGFAYSDGVTIGYETNAPSISNVTVRNCDILLARGGSRVEGHSGFSIICDGPAMISNILFEDIRVEESEVKLFELQVTDGTKYGTDPPGNIKNITLRNIHWYHEGPIVLKGFDENHRVQEVVFENCKIGGKPLKEIQSKVSQINEYVDKVIVR